MTPRARNSPTTQRLRERLPEFRPTFDDDEALLRRVFAAVDEVYADHSLVDGHDLAIEFFEAVCDADRPRFEPYTNIEEDAWRSSTRATATA